MAKKEEETKPPTRGAALLFALRAQEVLDAASCVSDGVSADDEHGRTPSALVRAYAAVDALRMLATNGEGVDEEAPLDPAAARAAVTEARAELSAAGLADALAARAGRTKQQRAEGGKVRGAKRGEQMWKRELASRVAPGLYVGGWTALRDDCAALRPLGVRAILSVGNFSARRLPPWVHMAENVVVDDAADADLGALFPKIVRFIATATAGGGCCFVHCGAGCASNHSHALVACAYPSPRAPRVALCMPLIARSSRAVSRLWIARRHHPDELDRAHRSRIKNHRR